ncbi:MAG TPA: FAD-dependent oxidoreductase [Candidatus Nanopelagicales bacterium]
MTQRVVVVGGDAGGMSAAAQLRRLRPDPDDVSIVALERQRWTSYSACGIPYLVAGDVEDADELVARSPEEHRRRGIDVRTRTECTAIDLGAGHVVTRTEDGATARIGFDELVIATGATPMRPDLPGIQSALGVHTIDDGLRVIEGLGAVADGGRAVVVGGGYVGVEMAEALLRRGLSVTQISRSVEPMASLDPDMGALVHEAMTGLGIDVRTGESVVGIETDGDGRARRVVTDNGWYDTDIVVLGIGVRPATTLAAEAGLPLGELGGLLTDDRQAVQDGVWAAGDCTQVHHRISGRSVHIALGTHANKQGRVAGTNLGGGSITFPGVVGTAITKVCDLEIARTGLREAEARALGYDVVTAVRESTSRSGYFPGAAPIVVKVIAENGSGRLLGVQIVGHADSAKRIDSAALALWNRMTARELAMADLAYAPPFSPVWDPVQIAARALADRLPG